MDGSDNEQTVSASGGSEDRMLRLYSESKCCHVLGDRRGKKGISGEEIRNLRREARMAGHGTWE